MGESVLGLIFRLKRCPSKKLILYALTLVIVFSFVARRRNRSLS